MRRLLAALVLAILPLQFAFAAAANYCAEEGPCAPAHFGHHECGHGSSTPTPGNSGTSSHDCGICHLSHAQAHPSVDGTAMLVADEAPQPSVASSPPGRSPEPLDRPPRAALA